MSFLLCLCTSRLPTYSFFFFNDTATTEIYTLSLHDALPISRVVFQPAPVLEHQHSGSGEPPDDRLRSEEHTSELQSRLHLVCRLLLEKKKKTNSQAAEPEVRARGTRWRAGTTLAHAVPETDH